MPMYCDLFELVMRVRTRDFTVQVGRHQKVLLKLTDLYELLLFSHPISESETTMHNRQEATVSVTLIPQLFLLAT